MFEPNYKSTIILRRIDFEKIEENKEVVLSKNSFCVSKCQMAKGRYCWETEKRL